MSDALSRSPSLARPRPGRRTLPGGLHVPIVGVMLLSTWAGVAGAAIPAQSKPAAGATQGFNFAYQSEGARAAAPSQVFDDGHRTYLQFNALDRVPELWTDDGKGRAGSRRLVSHLESPYVIVDQVLPRLRLVLEGQDTVLINQAWRAARPVTPGPARAAGAPRIWTDTTPFGPGDPPGPVASAREARPSHEPRKPQSRPANTAQPPQPALALSEDDDASEPDQDALAPPAAGTDPEQAEAELAAKPILASDRFVATRLEAMRGEALAMIDRAHAAGDARLEAELRRIFREIADASLVPQANAAHARSRRDPAPAPVRPAMLAMADVRPRSDVPPRDEGSLDDAGPTTHAGQVSATGGAAAATKLDAGARPVPGFSFEIRDNQRLSQALAHFLETLGWRLEWESQSDFVVRRGYVVRAASLREVLLETLGEYRLSAVLYSGNLVVAVTGGER